MVRRDLQAILRVTGLDAADTKIAVDFSDAPVIIDTVQILSPNGGETLTSGSITTITWATFTTVPVASVTLKYTVDGGANWNEIAVVPGNPGSYAWLVPAPTPAAQVKVFIRNAGLESLGADTSNSDFTIDPAGP